MEDINVEELTRTEAHFDLGKFHRNITTSSPEAQRWFDRGLTWTYAFNHETAIRCFQAAIKADPDCAIAYWGLSYANGINYNNPDCEEEPGRFPSNADAFDCGHKAAALADTASPVEKALITAILKRNSKPGPASKEERRTLNKAFAEAMEVVYTSFPDDPDVACLFAEAIMNVRPWDLWVDGKMREADDYFMGTARIMDVFKEWLPRCPDHPGLLHFYLHTVEMSPDPGQCLPECERLLTLIPDAGHLLHMPSHIYVLVGHYPEAVRSNQLAVATDRKYIKNYGVANFYTLYRCHDYHMLVYAAMFQGVYESALASALEMQRQLLSPELDTMMRSGLADFLEAFVPLPMHVLVRFGKWEKILAESLPEDQDFYCTTTAVIRYARCLAFAALKQMDEALAEVKRFDEAYAKLVPTRTLFNNTSIAILAVGREMLYGEVDYRRGRFDSAFEHLRKAVELDDSLIYDEQWGWMQPARHALGALLLEQGRAKEAEEVYPHWPEAWQAPEQCVVIAWVGRVPCVHLGTTRQDLDQVEAELKEAQSKARDRGARILLLSPLGIHMRQKKKKKASPPRRRSNCRQPQLWLVVAKTLEHVTTT